MANFGEEFQYCGRFFQYGLNSRWCRTFFTIL